MTVKEARKLAIAKYKKHKLNSWIIGVACGLFCAAVILLDLLITGLSFVTIPLLVFPFLFACYVFDVGYQEGLDLTFSGFVKGFLSYFKSPFVGSFNVIRSFFKSFLVFIVSLFLSTFICFFVFEKCYGMDFIDLYTRFGDYMYSYDIDFEVLNSLLFENDGLLMRFGLTSLEGPLFLSILLFVYFTSRESVSVFLRLKMPKSNTSMVGNIYRRTFYKNRKEFLKIYWGLNWPFYLLLLIGFVSGCFLIGFIAWDPFTSITVGAAIGFGLASFFFPFFFSNNLVLHEYLEPKYIDGMNDIINDIIRRVEIFNDLTPEEKEKLARNIRETGDPLGATRDKGKDEDE